MRRLAILAASIAVLLLLADALRTARMNMGALSADLVALCEHSSEPRCAIYRRDYWTLGATDHE
jgi:hypothetical protein